MSVIVVRSAMLLKYILILVVTASDDRPADHRTTDRNDVNCLIPIESQRTGRSGQSAVVVLFETAAIAAILSIEPIEWYPSTSMERPTGYRQPVRTSTAIAAAAAVTLLLHIAIIDQYDGCRYESNQNC